MLLSSASRAHQRASQAYGRPKAGGLSTGRRFAKRDRSLTLRSLRESGKTPEEIFELIDRLPPPSSGEVAG